MRAQMTRAEMCYDDIKTVIITIRGGLVEGVDLPPGVRVIVRDFDVDGALDDVEMAIEIIDGERCIETIYEI